MQAEHGRIITDSHLTSSTFPATRLLTAKPIACGPLFNGQRPATITVQSSTRAIYPALVGNERTDSRKFSDTQAVGMIMMMIIDTMFLEAADMRKLLDVQPTLELSSADGRQVDGVGAMNFR
jgi:hypothetical protein